jgi:hypothetical protein
MNGDENKYTFSKIILMVLIALSVGITLFSCIMMYITSDISPLAYLVPSIFTELATSTGFYYWKAKAENKSKLRNQVVLNILQMRSEYKDADIDAADELLKTADSIINEEDDA